MALESQVRVLVSAGEALLALESAAVEGMVVLPALAGLPGTPAEVRGVATWRGQTLLTVELRALLGQPSAAQEVEAMLAMLTALTPA